MAYAISTLLAITSMALALFSLFSLWRVHVWKRRAKATQLSLWQAMQMSFAQGVADNRSHKLKQAQSSEWPEVVND